PGELSSARSRHGRRVLLGGTGARIGEERMNRLLVCAPDHYRIAYEINPWMHLDRGADPSVARVQWENLTAVLEKDCGAALERMTPVEGLPDMVFTANAGIVVQGKAILSRFRHPERQPEEG